MALKIEQCRKRWPLIPLIVIALVAILLNGRSGHFLHRAPSPRDKTSHLPNITIIATGGTIAGVPNSPEKTTDYRAGVLHINEVIRSVENELRSIANTLHDQFSNIDSINANSSFSVSLSQHVTEELGKEATQGVVVTTGTHLLCDLAFILDLTILINKPVVLTGAIRPHGSPSADGPGHILGAVATAGTTEWTSEELHVAIAIQGRIMASRGTRKEDDRFLPGPRSLLGGIKDSKPFKLWSPGSCVPIKFNISGMPLGTSLPRVEIFPVHPDFGADLVEAAIRLGAQGLVMISYGDGYWPEGSALQIQKLLDKNNVTAVLANEGQLEYVANARSGFGIPGGDWDPHQLRILLQLLLLAKATEEEIRSVILMGPASCGSTRRVLNIAAG